jgi:hypothetical protein
MAINVFKSITHNLTTSTVEVYTAPEGFSGIILMAQITNVTAVTETVNMSLISNSVETFLAYEYGVPGRDAAGVLTGKLVLESGQTIAVSSSSNGTLQLVMSILESQN